MGTTKAGSSVRSLGGEHPNLGAAPIPSDRCGSAGDDNPPGTLCSADVLRESVGPLSRTTDKRRP